MKKLIISVFCAVLTAYIASACKSDLACTQCVSGNKCYFIQTDREQLCVSKSDGKNKLARVSVRNQKMCKNLIKWTVKTDPTEPAPISVRPTPPSGLSRSAMPQTNATSSIAVALHDTNKNLTHQNSSATWIDRTDAESILASELPSHRDLGENSQSKDSHHLPLSNAGPAVIMSSDNRNRSASDSQEIVLKTSVMPSSDANPKSQVSSAIQGDLTQKTKENVKLTGPVVGVDRDLEQTPVNSKPVVDAAPNFQKNTDASADAAKDEEDREDAQTDVRSLENVFETNKNNEFGFFAFAVPPLPWSCTRDVISKKRFAYCLHTLSFLSGRGER